MARYEEADDRNARHIAEDAKIASDKKVIDAQKSQTGASEARIEKIKKDAHNKVLEDGKKRETQAQLELNPRGLLTPKQFVAEYQKTIPGISQQDMVMRYGEYRNAQRMNMEYGYEEGGQEGKFGLTAYLAYEDKKQQDFQDSLGPLQGLAKGGPVYRAFGGGIGYGRGGYGAGNTGRMQAARGNQFMMQQHQQGMNFMNQTRNRAITPNISRMGRGNFAGGNSLQARKAQELFPYDPNGVMLTAPFGPNLEGNYGKFQSILRRNGPQFALRYAFGKQIPPGAYIGPKGAGKKKAEELNPEQMQARMITMMYNQMRRQEAQRIQQQQQQRGGGVRPLGRAAGGGVPGGDTVPAMLTPGEFVMSAGAVRQHGVGAMKSLNRGQVPGFNRGGVVGGVQYRQDGGGILGNMASGAAKMMGLDTSEMGSLFDNFVGSFSKTLDNLTSPLTLLAASMNNLADKFGNFTMTHKVEISGLPDIDANLLGNQLGESIAKNTVEKVQSALDENNNNFNIA